jgi:putative FmdB family regulatory protein
MPVYTYECPFCDHTEEVYRAIMDETEVECPKCAESMDRIPSVPSPPQGGPTKKFYPNRW